jgi:radical SAM-linked protein
MTRATKLRLRFAKQGDLRLISHHDIMRCLERMVRRAGIAIAMSQGFNPRPKIVFALPLGLGIEGRNEVVDLELREPEEPAELLRKLRESAPAGFQWLNAEPLPPGASPPRPVSVEYQIEIPRDRREAVRSALSTVLESEQWPITRRRHGESRTQTIDLRPFLLAADLTDHGMLRARLKVGPEGSARPEELLDSLGVRDLLDHGACLVREDVELA